ncbi:MAG: hypothetical protein KJ623_03845 [Nanoarchaeota archaeon]|nr:hypothetical protein [Nanoarchaeota archaeon]
MNYYSRKDIQEELFRISKNREVQIWINQIRGKRPEVINYLGDVNSLVRDGMTSLHISVERWKDPLQLKAGMSKKELDELRLGFDLLLDIDSKYLEYSKITAELLVDALKFHDVKDVFLKFSGNHGFHIAVPFEAFPETLMEKKINLLYPDVIKIIAFYLKEMIYPFLMERLLKLNSIEEIAKNIGKNKEDIMVRICNKCKGKGTLRYNYIHKCSHCGREERGLSNELISCPDCKHQIKTSREESYECSKCDNKEEDNFSKGDELDPFSAVDIDTILISSRHMFRAPYSINEKSGLVSIPIKDVKSFKLEDAKPENVKINIKFLDYNNVVKGSANQLLLQAYDWNIKRESVKVSDNKTYSIPTKEIKEELFPPCITKLVKGVTNDGRKRGVFILINFLIHMGWSIEKIESYLMEWNKKNYEPLKEGYIKAQVLWYKKQNSKILPANCDNLAYYKSIGICEPDNLCAKIKNPVNYAIRKSSFKGKR